MRCGNKNCRRFEDCVCVLGETKSRCGLFIPEGCLAVWEDKARDLFEMSRRGRRNRI